jgi:alkylated DNA repair protein (DNA oxidative demethylase)
MTNAGSHGWFSDREGYRYVARHPETGRPWPAVPAALLALWRAVADYPADPECCLVNVYAAAARMGLHRDADEETFAAPVVSLSLGDSAVFRIGGNERRGPTTSLRLQSGDVVVLAGAARLAYHGIDRVLGGSSRLLEREGWEGGGRINVTLRRVTRPPDEAA